MLKYLEDKFNYHPENMVSYKRNVIPNVSTKESNDSLVITIESKNDSKSTPYSPEVDTTSYTIPVEVTKRNRHAHWNYSRIYESRSNMEHILITIEMSIQIRENESGKVIIYILPKAITWGGGEG